MKNKKRETRIHVVDTTIGELVSAIVDATSEEIQDPTTQLALTKLIFVELLRRREQLELE